jgi:hypothetical protein
MNDNISVQHANNQPEHDEMTQQVNNKPLQDNTRVQQTNNQPVQDTMMHHADNQQAQDRKGWLLACCVNLSSTGWLLACRSLLLSFVGWLFLYCTLMLSCADWLLNQLEGNNNVEQHANPIQHANKQPEYSNINRKQHSNNQHLQYNRRMQQTNNQLMQNNTRVHQHVGDCCRSQVGYLHAYQLMD